MVAPAPVGEASATGTLGEAGRAGRAARGRGRSNGTSGGISGVGRWFVPVATNRGEEEKGGEGWRVGEGGEEEREEGYTEKRGKRKGE